MNQQNKENQGRSDSVLPAEAERRVKEDVDALAETAKREASNIKHEAEAEIGALAEEGKRQVNEMATRAKSYANEQKEVFADQLGGVAHAMHTAASELDQENSATAGYAHQLADGIDRITQNLRSRDIDGLIAMAEDFGRKQPAAFMACAALAGFAASRFLRASSSHAHGATAGATDNLGANAPGYSQAAGTSNTDAMGRPYQ